MIVLAAIFSSVVAGLNVFVLNLLSEVISNDNINRVHYMLLSIGLVLLSTGTSVWIHKYSTFYYEHKVSDFRRELARRILKVGYEKIESIVYKISPLLLFEIGTIGHFGKAISRTLVSFFQALVVLVMMVKLSTQMTMAVLLVFVIIFFVNYFTLPVFKRLEKSLSEIRGKFHVNLDRLRDGLKDLKTNYSHGNYFIEGVFNRHSWELANTNAKVDYRKTTIETFNYTLAIISFVIIVVFSKSQLEFQSDMLIKFFGLLLFLIPSLNAIGNFFKDSKAVENALEQLEAFDVKLTQAQKKIETDCLAEDTKGPWISLDRVSFEYPNRGKNAFVMGPISFTIPKNSITIINGGNGSGKTTLYKIITGLYESYQGSVVFQGQLLTSESVAFYQSHLSCVYTDSPIFDDLSYIDQVKTTFTGKSIVDYLELTGKTTLDTKMNLDEVHLSQGQKGRLNLMRVLLEDKPICLFDEWAANQDVMFRKKFYTQIIPELKKQGKTIILISHDEKYYDVADQLITLKNGKIEKIVIDHQVD